MGITHSSLRFSLLPLITEPSLVSPVGSGLKINHTSTCWTTQISRLVPGLASLCSVCLSQTALFSGQLQSHEDHSTHCEDVHPP